MKLKKLIESDDAVVGVITVVLIIGVLVAVLTLVNSSYVPQWIEEEEAKHMTLVHNQFADLKHSLDMQSLTNEKTAISTYITLSRNEIPFFDEWRSNSKLQLLSNSSSIIFESNTSSNTSITSSAIAFYSKNTYFVNQIFVYEMGTYLLAQQDSSVMKGRPSIIVEEYGNNISITIVNISGISGKTFAAGNGAYPIYTEVISDPEDTIKYNVTGITVYTSFPNAWHKAFNNSLRNTGIDFEIIKDNNKVEVNFDDPSGDYYNMFIKEVKISAQIAWGLIE